MSDSPTSTDDDFALDLAQDFSQHYARMVKRYLRVPTALVTLVEADRQVFLASAGLPEPWATRRETPLTHSFCQHVVADAEPLVVTDARTDERVADNAAITDLGVVAYAGWPLLDRHGTTVGALCAIDDHPRDWTRDELDTLADLAQACSGELAHRQGREDAERETERARELHHRSRVLLALSEGLSATRTLDDIAYAVERVAIEQLECMHGGIWLLRPARSAVEVDELHHISDPTSHWWSAARNASLTVSSDNPLGAALVSGKALTFATTLEQNARFPDLDLSRQVGQSRYFMPLGSGRAFGVLALVWEHEHEMSAELRITIAALASYVAQAVQRAELLEQRERASATLQTAMLPRLPHTEQMELTARYRPAAVHDRVGGDWYDAVVTHSGAVDLMIGDVAGHDIAAAAVMGEVRSMLRAFSFGHDAAPADNVAQLDEALARFGIDRFTSLLYARAEPARADGSRALRWTNAGHFPPLLVLPDGQTELLGDGCNDLVLGVDATAPRHDQEHDVPQGAILVLYTDGLVERRGEHLVDGLARLGAAARRHHALAPGAFLDHLIEDMVGAEHEDDIAVLAARFTR